MSFLTSHRSGPAGSGGRVCGITPVALLSAAVLLGSGCQAAAPGSPATPVMVGGDPDLDACAIGVVSAGGRGTVQAGPGRGFGRLDDLQPGRRVWLCDRADGFVGIVYGEEPRACGLASPRSTRGPYDGPCASGWIDERRVQLTAG
ncbi:MAG: hypothetical protein R3349_06775 [Geminicoccaceae bacterium]|nr:hypothetical protein [Geminicoccaceae bacterium]